jgi:ribosomal protein L22
MKIKYLGAAVMAGFFALATVPASYAAENASGVAEYAAKSADEAKKALEELQGGRGDEARAALKNVRQYTKEITGDAAGMSLQQANKAVKEAIRVLEEEKDLKKSAEVLAPAVKTLQDIAAAAKKK